MTRGAVIAEFVIAFEVDIAHERARFRLPVRTTLRLPLALSDRLKRRTVEDSGSPGTADVPRPVGTHGATVQDWRRVDVLGGTEPGEGGSIEARKDTPFGRPTGIRGEAIEEKCQRRRNESSTIPWDNVLGNGWTPRDDAPQLRLPTVTSTAIW